MAKQDILPGFNLEEDETKTNLEMNKRENNQKKEVITPSNENKQDTLPGFNFENKEYSNPPTILDRKLREVDLFSTEARTYLYHEIEKRAYYNNKLYSFYAKVGDVDNFIQLTEPFPEAPVGDEEAKKKDPYYAYPIQYSQGSKTYTTEFVNTGGGYFWEVTKIQTKTLEGEEISWKVKTTENPYTW